ncbi:MAG: SpoIVB peptidase [Clostridia bacterium]|nr:SpoIVB peptidase [Clostridia bacterium]
MKNITKKAGSLVFILVFTLSFFTPSANSGEKSYEKRNTGAAETFSSLNYTDTLYKDGAKISSRFLELLFNKKAGAPLMLCPSGEAFGILIKEDGVTVCSTESCELEIGDKIIKIGSTPCYESEEVYEAVRQSGGAPLKMTVIRNGNEIFVTATPKYKDGEYRLGITLRSQSAGIGTMTFYDPHTLSFGGLGHAVSDAESGSPVSLKSGIACNVLLGSCKKGEPGRAGELSGILGRSSLGSIARNTECGIFGKLEKSPETERTPLPVAQKFEVKCGEAEIVSTVKNGKTATYKIEITEIDPSSQTSKSFKIKVTDPALIALTGGIVRGMSGSPIIQDGKLVGAVTHVMVADPTEGYGIFIENMLSAAEMPMEKAA